MRTRSAMRTWDLDCVGVLEKRKTAGVDPQGPAGGGACAGAVPYCAVPCCAVPCCAVPCYAVPCYAVLCCAVPCCACGASPSHVESNACSPVLDVVRVRASGSAFVIG